MTPVWFILLLLCANSGASVVFLASRNYPWALIYAGAALIQVGGVFWLNLGDSYAGSAQGWGHGKQYVGSKQRTNLGSLNQPLTESKIGFERPPNYISSRQPNGLKPKDLIGVPWLVAFALRMDGWWLRSDIIWAKKNCMPESVQDRPTRSHEYLFLLTKSQHYYYDGDAIKEPAIYSVAVRIYHNTHRSTT